MKKFVVNTVSESCDRYAYFIMHEDVPTNEEMEKFLMVHGNDVNGKDVYESVESIFEIKEEKFKLIPD